MTRILLKVARFLPAILWMLLIFFLSSQQTIGIGQTRTERFLILKTFHLIEYAILYILVYFATNSTKNSIIISYSYALTDEFHQSFVPGRDGRFADTLIDLLGIIIGVVMVKLIVSTINRIKAS